MTLRSALSILVTIFTTGVVVLAATVLVAALAARSRLADSTERIAPLQVDVALMQQNLISEGDMLREMAHATTSAQIDTDAIESASLLRKVHEDGEAAIRLGGNIDTGATRQLESAARQLGDERKEVLASLSERESLVGSLQADSERTIEACTRLAGVVDEVSTTCGHALEQAQAAGELANQNSRRALGVRTALVSIEEQLRQIASATSRFRIESMSARLLRAFDAGAAGLTGGGDEDALRTALAHLRSDLLAPDGLLEQRTALVQHPGADPHGGSEALKSHLQNLELIESQLSNLISVRDAEVKNADAGVSAAMQIAMQSYRADSAASHAALAMRAVHGDAWRVRASSSDAQLTSALDQLALDLTATISALDQVSASLHGLPGAGVEQARADVLHQSQELHGRMDSLSDARLRIIAVQARSTSLTREIASTLADLGRQIDGCSLQVTRLAQAEKDHLTDLVSRGSHLLELLLGVVLAMVLIGIAVGLWVSRRLTRTLALVNVRLAHTAHDLALSAERLGSDGSGLSVSAEKGAHAVEQFIATLTEISASLAGVALTAEQADANGRDTRRRAEEGTVAIASLSAAMGDLGQRMERTAKIVRSINEIAAKTNLLALNASIEAARAGEHGRSFAVVAGEVRSLSQRATVAAQESAVMLTDCVDSMSRSRLSTDAVGKIFEAINAAITALTDLNGSLALSNREQARGVKEMNRAMVEIDQLTRSSAENAQHVVQAGEVLSMQAGVLTREVATLTQTIGQGSLAPRKDAHAAEPGRAPVTGPLQAADARFPRLQ